MRNRYDAIIFGAGPAGLAAAIRLAIGGKRVAVIERLSVPRRKVCGGFIGSENREILERFGVWDKIYQEGTPLRDLLLSAGPGREVMLGGEQTPRGIGMSRARFDHILVERARELGVTVLDESTHTVRDDNGMSVCAVRHIPTGEHMELVSGCFIRATGANKRHLKTKKYFGAYALFAPLPELKGDVALYFAEGGHLGLNRFEGGEINACYVVEEALFQKYHGDMESIFAFFLEAHPALARSWRAAKRITPFKGTAFGEAASFRFAEGNAYLVGDGVGVINPVVGGGNTLALMSGVMLAEELLAPADPSGAAGVLRRYERRWREAFARRVRHSWLLGYLSHRRFCARAVMRMFQWQRTCLEDVFQTHHQGVSLSFECPTT